MKLYYQIKRQLKLIRLELRRARVARRWGKDVLDKSPSIFGNAIPKAGSHLLIQVLLGLMEIGPFVNPGFPPINRFEMRYSFNRLLYSMNIIDFLFVLFVFIEF